MKPFNGFRILLLTCKLGLDQAYHSWEEEEENGS